MKLKVLVVEDDDHLREVLLQAASLEGYSASAARLQVPRPDLKVIFTDGYSPELAGEELNLQEGQNFLAKPTRPHQILAAVRRCLDS